MLNYLLAAAAPSMNDSQHDGIGRFLQTICWLIVAIHWALYSQSDAAAFVTG